MESLLAEIERLMQDPTADQELDEGFRATSDFEEPPECDCVAIAADPDPNEWVDDRDGCGNCAGCAYCMVLGDYDPEGEV